MLISTLLINAFVVSNEIGLFASDVLSIFPKSSEDLLITTSPVKVFTEVTDKVGILGLLIKSL